VSKYVVTGNAGFIGSHLTDRLLSDGHTVVGIDNLSTGFREYLPKHPNFTFLELDITDWPALARHGTYFKGASCVFHLAAFARIQPSVFNPSLTHDTNVTGTLNVLELMRLVGKNIVYSASSSYYGKKAVIPSRENDANDCQTPYSVSKYMGELLCSAWSKTYGINNARLRYFNVWGPRSPLSGPYSPIVSKFFRQALLDKSDMTVVGDGLQKRDFTYVDDVVDANIKAAAYLSSTPGQLDRALNIGTGKNYTILKLANMVNESVIRADGRPANIEHIPERVGEAQESRADNTEAERVLGWVPKYSLEQKIDELRDYYIAMK